MSVLDGMRGVPSFQHPTSHNLNRPCTGACSHSRRTRRRVAAWAGQSVLQSSRPARNRWTGESSGFWKENQVCVVEGTVFFLINCNS